MNFKIISAVAAGLMSMSTVPALAAPVTLTFDELGDYTFIEDFYNGGFDSEGNTGPSYGVSFGPGAIALSNSDDFVYYSNAPTPGAVFSPVDGDSYLNVAAGFSNSASLFYSSSEAAEVNVYSGLNGTGSVLATFYLLANAQTGCDDSLFCNWDELSVTFEGLAKSIQFANAAGLAGFDNISVAPVPLPAAGWLMLSALGGLGAAVRRRKRASASAI